MVAAKHEWNLSSPHQRSCPLGDFGAHRRYCWQVVNAPSNPESLPGWHWHITQVGNRVTQTFEALG
jgi:hypothetical protein